MNNSAKNCRAYNSFISVASDHHIIKTSYNLEVIGGLGIISANIRLSLRANNKQSSKIKHYDWEIFKTDTETRDIFITKVKTKFKALQDTIASLSASKMYTNFETACKEIAVKVIPLKPELKKRITWETDNI